MKSKLFFLFLIFNFLMINTSLASEVVWSATNSPLNGSLNVVSVAFNTTGSKILVAVYGGKLYLSEDYGQTWSTTGPTPSSNQYWQEVSCDSECENILVAESKLTATTIPGKVYFSSDGGDNWVETKPAGETTKLWSSVALNSTGTKRVAVVKGGRIYTYDSENGAVWSEVRPSGDSNYNWQEVALDSSGSNLIVGANSGRLWLSNNFGAVGSWTELQLNGNVNYGWQEVDFGNDGNSIIVTGNNTGSPYTGKVWVYDGDTGWSAALNPYTSGGYYGSVSIDSDGDNLMALVYSNDTFSTAGRLYLSNNGGSSWSESRPAGDNNLYWWVSGINSSATRFFASIYGGLSYLGVLTPKAPTLPIISEITNTSAKLSWTDNSSYEDNFKIKISTDGITFSESTTATADEIEKVISSLTPNTRYWLQVASSKDDVVDRDSSYVTASDFYTSATTPSSMSASFINRNNDVTVSWTGDATDYYVGYDGGNSGWITDTTYTFEGLSCGVDYTFSVKGRNVSGIETDLASTTAFSRCPTYGSYLPEVWAQMQGSLVPTSNPIVDNKEEDICTSNIKLTDFMKEGDRDNKYGSYNKKIVTQIKTLQSHINDILADKYTKASGPVDGIFGPLTKQGVKRMQTVLNENSKANLLIDGIVGPLTQKAINEYCGN